LAWPEPWPEPLHRAGFDSRAQRPAKFCGHKPRGAGRACCGVNRPALMWPQATRRRAC